MSVHNEHPAGMERCGRGGRALVNGRCFSCAAIAATQEHHRYVAMSPTTRTTACPECGNAIVWKLTYQQELPGIVSPDDTSDWFWEFDIDRNASVCQCLLTLNVETWEGERVVDALVAGDDADVEVPA